MNRWGRRPGRPQESEAGTRAVGNTVDSAGGDWIKGQLHVHTSRSLDGRLDPEAVMDLYRRQGFDFVCITDHDRTWDDYGERGGLVVVPGEESTLLHHVPPLGRHMLRLFVTTPAGRWASASRKMNRTIQSGGLLGAAHPAWSGNLGTGRWSAEALADPRLLLVEIVNHHSPTPANVALWDRALVLRGPRHPLWAAAVDDSHRPEHVGRGWVWVQVPAGWRELPSPREKAASLSRALREGRFYATTGPQMRVVAVASDGGGLQALEVEVPPRHASLGGSGRDPSPGSSAGPAIRFVAAGGRPLATLVGCKATYAVRGDEGYVRAEAEVPGLGSAWSQPCWIRQPGQVT